jgi:hypothetical protein
MYPSSSSPAATAPSSAPLCSAPSVPLLPSALASSSLPADRFLRSRPPSSGPTVIADSTTSCFERFSADSVRGTSTSLPRLAPCLSFVFLACLSQLLLASYATISTYTFDVTSKVTLHSPLGRVLDRYHLQRNELQLSRLPMLDHRLAVLCYGQPGLQ